MTAGAQAFVTPLTLQALTGQPVRTDLLDPAAEAAMGHIELARWADSVLVAPASANTLARLAGGFADDLLSTLCLATDAPLYVAPAMNRLMWAHPATTGNVARLVARGVVVLEPAEGPQACGETGAGRMPEPEELRDALAAHVGARLGERSPRSSPRTVETTDVHGPDVHGVATNGASTKDVGRASGTSGADDPLAGLSIVVSAGPTQEAIDPVRFLGNRSSGRMGFAVAAAAARRGARVTLVAGPVALETPPGVERRDVVSARDMREAVLAAVTGADGEGRRADVFVGVAAVADYRVADVASEKIKKSAESMTLELVRNPDILAEVAALPERPFSVGFAAETERVEMHARGKLERKRLDLIAANRVAQPGNAVFGSDTNALDVFWPPDGHVRIDTARKGIGTTKGLCP